MKRSEITTNEINLIATLNKLIPRGNKAAIVGGHYILLYETKTDSLKPAIFEEFEEGSNKLFSRIRARNFPVKSFQMSIDLMRCLRIMNIECKCVLLVNDESFLGREFRDEVHHELVKDKGKELRKKYYASTNNLPMSFRKILAVAGFGIDQVFHKFHHPHSSEDNYLPSESIFVSERKLCKSFKKTVKKLRSTDRLFSLTGRGRETEDDNNVSVQTDTVNVVCLIEQGICNCGGKAFQFYFDLIKRDYQTIVFFVPAMCTEQVNAGAQLICSSDEFGKQNITLINISKIESDPDAPVFNKELLISLFKT